MNHIGKSEIMQENGYILKEEYLEEYRKDLLENERSKATIEKYIRDIRAFYKWNQDKVVDRLRILEWKGYLEEKYAITSANSMLAAVNGFFLFKGWLSLRVKPFKQQKQIYRDERKDMSREEYMRLLDEADKQGNERMKLVMQTICSTGIRVSELQFITAEAVAKGKVMVNGKNKKRVVFIPKQLCKILNVYMKKNNINKGPIFLTRGKKVLNRSNIWSSMKKLCEKAGIDKEKVFPHNLRHLFAKTFYKKEKDLAKLADVLGHLRIETTRIYIMESGREHERLIERLGLIGGEFRRKRGKMKKAIKSEKFFSRFV